MSSTSKQSEDDLLAEEAGEEGEEDKESLADERNAVLPRASQQLKNPTPASSEEINLLTNAILGLRWYRRLISTFLAHIYMHKICKNNCSIAIIFSQVNLLFVLILSKIVLFQKNEKNFCNMIFLWVRSKPSHFTFFDITQREFLGLQ